MKMQNFEISSTTCLSAAEPLLSDNVSLIRLLELFLNIMDMTINNYNVRTYLKDGGAVMVRVRWNRQMDNIAFATGKFAEESKWDSVKQRAIDGTTHIVGKHHISKADEINESIARIVRTVDDLFVSFEESGTVPTRMQLKNAVVDRLGIRGSKSKYVAGAPTSEHRHQSYSLKDMLAEFKSEHEHKWEVGSEHRYSQAVSHAYLYDPKVRVDTIDKKFMLGLVKWHIDNGYTDDTTNSKLSSLRTLLRWGMRNGYAVNQSVFDADTTIPHHQKRVIYMKYEELKEFLGFRFPDDRKELEKYRDMWCFMAFTGLRYSDMSSLKKSDLLERGYIELYTEKTEEYLRIPILKSAAAIINKYRKGPGENVFPKVSNQKVNEYVKEAARLAGIEREVVETRYIGKRKVEEKNRLCDILSCHDARRTFVCCSLRFGMAPTTVMKITGHASYNAMKPYIEVADETVMVEMLKWEKDSVKAQIITLMNEVPQRRLNEVLELLRSMKTGKRARSKA